MKVSTPPASSEAALKRMKSVRQTKTRPEQLLGSAMHKMGLRYRKNIAPINGVRSRADFVFCGPKVAVFVDGCFWHVCPIHASWPKRNAAWWRKKLNSNVARDRKVDCQLTENGWQVVRAWEHENPGEVAIRVADIVKSRAGFRNPV